MPLTNEEKDGIRAILERMPDNVLEVIRENAEQLVSDLEDLNSMFPATKEFLTARGLTNVRQLDKTGREELVAHLQNVLRLARN